MNALYNVTPLVIDIIYWTHTQQNKRGGKPY